MKSRSDWGLRKVTPPSHGGGTGRWDETGSRIGQTKGYGAGKRAVAMEIDEEGQRRETAEGRQF